MPKTSKRASRAKRRAPLTREQVFRAAVALADGGGLDALTMRKLADKLGVEAMSLYHHVANKDQILDGMVDAMFDEIEAPSSDVHWKTALRRRCVSAREALMRHRWAVGMLDSRRNPGVATLRHHDEVLGVLRRAGFSITMAGHAFSAIDSYVYGFVLQELSLPFKEGEEVAEVAAPMLEAMPEGALPYLTEMLVHALRPGYAYGNEFPFGLDLILDALERQLG